MLKTTTGAHCAYEPADLRSAYIALFLLCLIGVAAVAVGLLVPQGQSQNQNHSGPFMTTSVHQVVSTATTVA